MCIRDSMGKVTTRSIINIIIIIKMNTSEQNKENNEKIHRHTLNSTWVFYYAPRGKRAVQTENYEDNLKRLGEFNTIEDFFSFYCYLRRPSEIDVDNKILMFRQGCVPLWEKWLNGGCWILQLKKKDTALLDNKWEALLFSCIGEEAGDTNLIGVVLSIRAKRNIIEVWLRDGSLEDKRVSIGEKLQKCLDLNPQNLQFAFKENRKALEDKSILKRAEPYSFVATPFETPMSTPVQPPKTTDLAEEMEKLNIQVCDICFSL
eukprot:TRINITY_DN3204_c0_g1_i2.p1 TRINITY_DN3204_c0_g1~~TRINITY_DN3204_c0_g1_i2.p1  ORF type:complete len:261 (-),score=83.67 TRINITY_DN3204_c0_g1_i2:140-922(-)